jgi:nucleotide-binding universal stress UspA family protein
LEEGMFQQLKKIKGRELFKNKEIHLVHCFQIHYYPIEFAFEVYPTEEDQPSVKKSVEEILESFKSEVLENNSNVVVDCLFSPTPKDRMIEYVKENGIDLVVVASKEKEGISGLFSSSLAEHMLKFSPCDVLMIRP